MLGKQKCRILKEIRQKIADENDIPYVTRECSFQGECRGTCPRCESELRYLEKELEKRAAAAPKWRSRYSVRMIFQERLLPKKLNSAAKSTALIMSTAGRRPHQIPLCRLPHQILHLRVPHRNQHHSVSHQRLPGILTTGRYSPGNMLIRRT